MAQGTGYTYNQRGDVVLATRTGTTRNQPSNYKPFKLLKGVDTTITFFIRDVNGCPVQLHEKNINAKMTKHDGDSILLNKNLRITDYTNGIATLHLTPGDIHGLDPAFYNILLTYTGADNKVTAMHADQNYRYCYVAEVEDNCGVPTHHGMDSVLLPEDFFVLSTSTLTASMASAMIFEGIIGVNFNLGLGIAITGSGGCHAVMSISINIGVTLSYSVSFTAIGVGYSVGDVILVRGSQLNGVDGVNDVFITVTGVDQSGGILTFTVSGTPNITVTTYVTNMLPGPGSMPGACNGLNTFSISTTRATGTMVMQATLSDQPGVDDWFDVPNVCGPRKEITIQNHTGTDAFGTDGMFMFIRFKFTLTIGSVDKIIYRR